MKKHAHPNFNKMSNLLRTYTRKYVTLKVALTCRCKIFIVLAMKKPRDVNEIKNIQGRILEAALDIIVQEVCPALTMRRIASQIGSPFVLSTLIPSH